MKPYKLSGMMSIAAMLFFMCATAQTNNIDFILSSTHVALNEHVTSINSTITKTESTITWVQENHGNSDTTIFNIESSSGTWDTTSSSGTINYEMNVEGHRSTLSLTDNTSNIIATITFQPNEPNEQIYKFYINNITYP